MEKIELQEIVDACEEAESEYIKIFRPLLGYEDNVVLNRGIDDSLEETLNEIEDKVGIEFPADFLQIYLIANGGKYFDINLYYLTSDKNDINGLYFKNLDQEFRKQYDIPDNMFVIGELEESQLILIGIDEEDYYVYCTWDKEEKAMDMEFDYLVELLAYEIDYSTNAFSDAEEK